jgi:uncharacterized membrane protein
MATLTHPGTHPTRPVNITHVAVEQPIEWLRLGWDDLRHTPGASLAYGFIVSAFGALILTFWSHPYLIAGSISGFLPVAFGFATFLVGMVVVFPLLGHATWHAYRDLVQ